MIDGCHGSYYSPQPWLHPQHTCGHLFQTNDMVFLCWKNGYEPFMHNNCKFMKKSFFQHFVFYIQGSKILSFIVELPTTRFQKM
jgi:hypothetical protein